MLQTTFNGIVTGVIMTLPALAVTLLFGVLKFPNFAVGAMTSVESSLTTPMMSAPAKAPSGLPRPPRIAAPNTLMT